MIIIHGNDLQKSRSYFQNRKVAAIKQGHQVVNLDGQSLTYSQFLTSITSTSFFSEKNTYFIEQLISRRQGKDKELILSYLKKNPQLEIFVWEYKDQSIQLKNFLPLNIVKFDYPKYVYDFIDNLDYVNLKHALKHSAPEQIFALLIKKVHELVLVKSGYTSSLIRQTGKLLQITDRLSLSDILSHYQELLKIDIRQKRSNSAFDLASALIVWTNKLQMDTKKR